MSAIDERGLVMRAVLGDQDAYAELVREHQQAVFNVAYRVLANVRDAEDAVQISFIRAFQALDQFDPARPLAPWLKRITVNVCLNLLESKKPTILLDEELLIDQGPESGPEGLIVLHDHNARIRAELGRLPPRFRAVVELRHFSRNPRSMNFSTKSSPTSNGRASRRI